MVNGVGFKAIEFEEMVVYADKTDIVESLLSATS